MGAACSTGGAGAACSPGLLGLGGRRGLAVVVPAEVQEAEAVEERGVARVGFRGWNSPSYEAGGSSGKYSKSRSGETEDGSTTSAGGSVMDAVELEKSVDLQDGEGLMGSLHRGSNKSYVLVEGELSRRDSSDDDQALDDDDPEESIKDG